MVQCSATIIVFYVRLKVRMCIRVRGVKYVTMKIMMTAIEYWNNCLISTNLLYSIIHSLELHWRSKPAFDTSKLCVSQTPTFFVKLLQFRLSVAIEEKTHVYQSKDYGSMFNHSRSTIQSWIEIEDSICFSSSKSFLCCLFFFIVVLWQLLILLSNTTVELG